MRILSKIYPRCSRIDKKMLVPKVWKISRRRKPVVSKATTAGADRFAFICGHRSVSKAFSLSLERREIVVRREKEGLRAKRKRKAFVAVGNERGESKGGEGGESAVGDPLDPRSCSVPRSMDQSRCNRLFEWVAVAFTLVSLIISIDLNVSFGYRIRIVVGRNGTSWFLRDSSLIPPRNLGQKRFNNGCRCMILYTRV